MPPRVALYNGTGAATGATAPYGIGAATQESDGSWTESGSNPVLQKGASGQWDDVAVKDPNVVWDGSQYVMYYAGSGSGYPQYQIGRATADDIEGPWTKYASNPVISQGSGGSWDDTAVLFPTVLYEPEDTGREWKMWYGGNDGSNIRIGYAYSSDGLSWTKHGQVIDIDSGTWDDDYIIPGSVIKELGTYYLFIGGLDLSPHAWTGGLYTFTDPEGTYTPWVGNPVLSPEGTSQDLTSDTAMGSAIVSVADTSGFVVGMPVALYDDNSETHIAEVASIGSATQLTLSSNAPAAFTTAQNAAIRPVTINAVYPRSVHRVSGGYEMFLTAHQPTIDLDPTEAKLREMAMRATSSDLLGPWDIQQGEGLMFALGAPSSSWDAVSAENPSITFAAVGNVVYAPGADAGIPSSFTITAGDPVIYATPAGIAGASVGIPSGFTVAAEGPTAVLLTVPNHDRPQFTDPPTGLTVPVLRHRATRKARWEEFSDLADEAGVGGNPTADTLAWMPLTSVDGGEPVLVWDDDDSLIPTLVNLE